MPTPHQPDHWSARSGSRERSSDSVKVLLVEDDEVLRTVLFQVLDMHGYQVDDVASGTEAVALFGDVRHDLVVTDLSMRGMSGWEVTQRLRTIEPRVAIIILTGYAARTDLERAEAERVTLLQKPVPMERLVETVATMTSARPRR